LIFEQTELKKKKKLKGQFGSTQKEAQEKEDNWAVSLTGEGNVATPRQ
jgi:hypothetical protein